VTIDGVGGTEFRITEEGNTRVIEAGKPRVLEIG